MHAIPMNTGPGQRKRPLQLALGALVLMGAFQASPASAEEVIVGQTLSLTGPSAGSARELQQGRQACATWVNEHGGIRGKSLRIVTRDDRGDSGLATRQVQELITTDGAVALFGSMGPTVNTSVLDLAATQELAVIGPYGGDIEIRARKPATAYFLTANQSAEAQRLGAHIASLALGRIAIVHATDRAGQAALAALEEGLGSVNMSAIALIPAKADGSDAANVARATSQAKPQAVLLATSGRATVALLQALHGASVDGLQLLQVYGLSAAASQAELLELGARARGFAMSQVVPLPRNTRLPLVLTFQAAMQAIPGERTSAELEGCMASLLLAEVLRKAPASLTPSGVLQALRGAGRINLGGFEIDLADRTGAGALFTDIVYVGANGRIIR